MNNWANPRFIGNDELQAAFNVNILEDGSISPRVPLYSQYAPAKGSDQAYPLVALKGRHPQTAANGNWATPDNLPTLLSLSNRTGTSGLKLGFNVIVPNINAVTNSDNLRTEYGTTPLYDSSILVPSKFSAADYNANTRVIDLIEHTPANETQVIYVLTETDNVYRMIMSGTSIGTDEVYTVNTTNPIWTDVDDFDEGEGTVAVVIGTDGGYIPPGKTTCLFNYLRDTWMIVGNDNRLWFSFKLTMDGSKGFQNWNECFKYDLPLDGEDQIQKILQWKETLLVFCERSIWQMYGGNPPNWNVRKLYDNIGITSSDHAVWTPYGIAFLDCQSGSVWMLNMDNLTNLWQNRLSTNNFETDQANNDRWIRYNNHTLYVYHPAYLYDNIFSNRFTQTAQSYQASRNWRPTQAVFVHNLLIDNITTLNSALIDYTKPALPIPSFSVSDAGRNISEIAFPTTSSIQPLMSNNPQSMYTRLQALINAGTTTNVVPQRMPYQNLFADTTYTPNMISLNRIAPFDWWLDGDTVEAPFFYPLAITKQVTSNPPDEQGVWRKGRIEHPVGTVRPRTNIIAGNNRYGWVTQSWIGSLLETEFLVSDADVDVLFSQGVLLTPDYLNADTIKEPRIPSNTLGLLIIPYLSSNPILYTVLRQTPGTKVL